MTLMIRFPPKDPAILTDHMIRPTYIGCLIIRSFQTEGKNQALVGAIPFCGEYPVPQFEDKFRSANQMDGISKAGRDKMAAS